MSPSVFNAEQQRLNVNAKKAVPLERWGPYLSERQWGTIREDYSDHGNAWEYFSHDDARSRVYKWGEDGIAGISDMKQNLCFAIAMWNGKDSILKERLFGLANPQGNHGEDVKELYYYLDNTPTHYYMEYLYKYPQAAFPYEDLLNTNAKRTRLQPEYELLDTGVFDDDKYFDVKVIYAKINDEDICINVTVTNHGTEAADIMLLPTLWFRNRWIFNNKRKRSTIKIQPAQANAGMAIANHTKMGSYYFYYESTGETLMTENETNNKVIFGTPNDSVFVKDAFHDALAGGDKALYKQLLTNDTGTKFSPLYRKHLQPQETQTISLRLCHHELEQPFDHHFHKCFDKRKKETDVFYESMLPPDVPAEVASIHRKALNGLLWNKQYYQYDVERWINGDDYYNKLPDSRKYGRNSNWMHLKNADVLSMPDKWEYPWYAAWDLCFQCIPMAMADPIFAKNQLVLLCREWFMSPAGQIPAYEWNFSDVNPPLQAWATLQVYKKEKTHHGFNDIFFLKRMFQKLMINFTWWANREDSNDNNIFSGGFLGLDNIGVIDRTNLPEGATLEQVDATAWMGMYALHMMEIAVIIAQTDKSFEDMATKFCQHFILISDSLNETLWDKTDHFFYDQLHTSKGEILPLKVRSIVGLSVLFDVSIIKSEHFKKLPDFVKRINYIKNQRKEKNIAFPNEQVNKNGDVLISLIPRERLINLLGVMLDEEEFLSPAGIRALSKYHKDNPFHLHFNDNNYDISYLPAESDNSMFGGNSNWRGPVWMPLNYLIIQTLYQLHSFYGDELMLSYPTGSGNMMNLQEIAQELAGRLIATLQTDEAGNRPAYADADWFYKRPENKDLLLFYEYFDGDTAKGLGAAHQTGWSSLLAALICEQYPVTKNIAAEAL